MRIQRIIRRELLSTLKANARSVRDPEVAQVCSSIRLAVLLDEADRNGWPKLGQLTLSPTGHVAPDEDWSFTIRLDAPHQCDVVRYLEDLVAQSLEPSTVNTLTRFVVWNRWEEHVRFLSGMNRYLSRFSKLRATVLSTLPLPVDEEESKTTSSSDAKRVAPEIAFCDAVSAVTGAVVVADLATSTTTLSTTQIVSWHERLWLGQPRGQLGGSNTSDRRQEHPQYLPETLVSPYELSTLENSTESVSGASARLGRFNGRIPVLLRAEVTQIPGLEEPILLLVTGETDYRSTEERDLDGSRPVEGPRSCKKLPFLPMGSPLSTYRSMEYREERFAGGVSDIYGRLDSVSDVSEDMLRNRILQPSAPIRSYQLNGKVTFISRSASGTGRAYVMLMNRAMGNENGYGIAATTAGGALSLPVEAGQCDGDEFGTLDALNGIRREISEELGLSDADYSMSLHAVVQHNSRPCPRVKDEVLDTRNGELTSTCLAIAHTPLGPDDLNARRFCGSASGGLSEAEGLISIPFEATAHDFYSSLAGGHYCLSCSSYRLTPTETPTEPPAVCDCGSEVVRLLDNVEQMALVSLMYCSALMYGVKSTIRAWGREPLWPKPFEIDDAEYSRVCVNPIDLSPSLEEPIAALFPDLILDGDTLPLLGAVERSRHVL